MKHRPEENGTACAGALRTRLAQAAHPETAPEHLAQLSQDGVREVRREVARNRRSPALVLEALLRDEDEVVRLYARISLGSQGRRNASSRAR